MKSEDKCYYVALNMVEGLGPKWISTLTEIFGGPQRVWNATEKDLLSVPKIPRKTVSGLLAKRKVIVPEEEFRRLCSEGINIVGRDDPEYPSGLRQIFDPPAVLYVKGSVSVLGMPMLAIVGARRATNYGLTVAGRIAAELADAGLCIVSGMARGIDSAAHRGALSVSKPTAAVFGCGVDCVYPPENKKLMGEIIVNGAVISEFAPGTPPVAGNFPQRNRIISGLAEGVLVVEAAERSGSLITVDFALEQGRDVFAVPGQVTNPLSRGTHRLIKEGAKLVESAGDILEELGCGISAHGVPCDKKLPDLTPEEKRVYNIISDDPVSSEAVIFKSELKSSEVLSLLFILELKGLVKQLPGQRYVRCP